MINISMKVSKADAMRFINEAAWRGFVAKAITCKRDSAWEINGVLCVLHDRLEDEWFVFPFALINVRK